MRKNIAKLTLSTAMAVGLMVMPGTISGAESSDANTPKEHAQVAKTYRLRAEAQEAKAAEHEANAKKMRNSTNAMAHKWPAMVNNGWQRESQLAVQARRAAQESRAIADRHLSLAVETQLSVD